MPGTLCEHCTGLCCRYIALPIDEPETRGDFDDMRWYLLHEAISIFVEDGDWYINMQTTCRHLQPDNRCGIYATRPKICRDYSAENCDYHSGDYGWDHHFQVPEHLDEYARVFLRGKRLKKRTGSTQSNGKKRRTGVHAHLGRGAARRTKKPAAPDTVDILGVALPVLRDFP
ncbi:MAG: YkgJ family cysteine cluster protein [Planctomycetes bacterium]|nr:YkgJ family cysteine cluster protein [Planctomycetota bacterium]